MGSTRQDRKGSMMELLTNGKVVFRTIGRHDRWVWVVPIDGLARAITDGPLAFRASSLRTYNPDAETPETEGINQ
jgi:hypothetical protein